MQTTLVGRDLWDVVERGVYTTPKEGDLKPKDTASEEAQKDDQKNRTVQKCAKARSIILRLCIPTIQMDILLETTA